MLTQLRQLAFADWIYGLLKSAIGGGASAVVGAISAGLIAPQTFNLSEGLGKTFKLVLSMFVINAVINLFYYLKQSPLPPVIENNGNVPGKIGKTVGVILFCILSLALVKPVQAQDSTLPPYMFGIGIGLDQSTDTTVMGSGWYAKQVKETFYSFSGYSAERVPGAVSKLGNISLPRFKFTPFTGFAVRILQLTPNLSLWQSTTGGVATTGDTVTGNLGMDGFLRWVIKGRSGIVAGLHFSHDAISGDGFSARLVYNLAGK